LDSETEALDCNLNTNGDQGCPVLFPSKDSYGPDFNNIGGGWYVFYTCQLSVRVLTRLKYLGMRLSAHQPTTKFGSGRGTPQMCLPTLKMVLKLLTLATGYVSPIHDIVCPYGSFSKRVLQWVSSQTPSAIFQASTTTTSSSI